MKTRPLRASFLWFVVACCALGGCDNSTDPVPRMQSDLMPAIVAGLVVDGAICPAATNSSDQCGEGWFQPEKTRLGCRFSWMKGTRAEVTVSTRQAGPGHIVVHGYCLNDGTGPNHLRLTVNGTVLKKVAVPSSWSPIVFTFPAGVVHEGENQIILKMDRAVTPAEQGNSKDRRPLGLAVAAVRFLPDTASAATISTNPFETSDIVLTTRCSVRLRLVNPAAANLVLDWSVSEPSDISILFADVIDPGTSTTVYRKEIPLSGCINTSIEFPDDLPSPCRLELRIEGDDSTSLRIEHASMFTPLNQINVVLIVIDTLRPDFLGCYGAEGDPSPNIDALAADGILFETALCPSPITGPSHASMFTSRHPSQVGIVNNARENIPMSLATLPEILQGAGHTTGAAISISPIAGGFGFSRGFSRYEDDLGIAWILNADVILPRALDVLDGLVEPLFFWTHFSDPHEPYDAHGLVEREAEVLVDGRQVALIPTSTYTPTEVELDLPTDREIEIIIRSDALFRPRNVSLRTTVGTPPTLTIDEHGFHTTNFRGVIGTDGLRRVRLLIHLADRAGKVDMIRQRYALETSYVDRHIGRLIDELHARGLYEESLIILAADHGEALGEHDQVGHVHTVYDCMVRVPLIIKAPLSAGHPVGSRRLDQAALIDILPTVLGQLSGNIPAGCEGRDLLAPGADRETVDVFLETHRPESKRTLFGLRGRHCKIILEPETGTWEFYDLDVDPGEIHNIFTATDEDIARWQDKLLARMANITSDDDNVSEAVDDRTREMLRSLGY